MAKCSGAKGDLTEKGYLFRVWNTSSFVILTAAYLSLIQPYFVQ